MATNKQSRTYAMTWTLYNYEPYVEALQQYAKDHCDYMVYGHEICPTTGRPHLQGYHHYATNRTYPNKKWRAVTDLEKNGRDFISSGTPDQNRRYCLGLTDGKTPNTNVWEYGECPSQGTRTDWAVARASLAQGRELVAVVEEQPQLLPCIRSLERFQQLCLRPLNREVNVFVLVGPPGTGKSKFAYDFDDKVYSKPEGTWFDGYTGQRTLLLDDYYGDLPYAQLLKVCDRYPLNVPVKGGFVYAQWTTVIITSNRQPEQWYQQNIDAFMRRVKFLDREHKHGGKDNETDSKASCTDPSS